MNKKLNKFQPLATRMRPRSLDEFVGQGHLLGQGKPLLHAIKKGILHSMIFWGPPGTGKTTLACLIASYADAQFKHLSAIATGVKEIRELISKADSNPLKKPLILFIDEIHRFNKAQQDIFLPFVENGTFILIGATTENPSFELNNALLSRMRVYILKPLQEKDLLEVLNNALNDKKRGLGDFNIDFPMDLKKLLIQAADGDARQVLNLLEILSDLAIKNKNFKVTEKLLAEVLQVSLRRFDKQGEAFYDEISALHKSIRGSAPDASLYWYCRMIDGGCDPLYIGRRLLRMASEDIGLADPRALTIVMDAYQIYRRLGSPEGELALAEAILYLACTSKSNSTYIAYNEAMNSAQDHGSLEVPLHLRNAPTKLMKELGYGKTYRYAHDEPNAYVAGENYFPLGMQPQQFYRPTSRGLEEKIAARLKYLKELDKKA